MTKSYSGNFSSIEKADKAFKTYWDFSGKRYSKLGANKFESIYGRWDSDTFIELRDLLFHLITGEPDFDAFYNRFDSPAKHKGEKPLAWGSRFLPDMILDELVSDGPIADRVEAIKQLYFQCQKLEEQFIPKKKRRKVK